MRKPGVRFPNPAPGKCFVSTRGVDRLRMFVAVERVVLVAGSPKHNEQNEKSLTGRAHASSYARGGGVKTNARAARPVARRSRRPRAPRRPYCNNNSVSVSLGRVVVVVVVAVTFVEIRICCFKPRVTPFPRASDDVYTYKSVRVFRSRRVRRVRVNINRN